MENGCGLAVLMVLWRGRAWLGGGEAHAFERWDVREFGGEGEDDGGIDAHAEAEDFGGAGDGGIDEGIACEGDGFAAVVEDYIVGGTGDFDLIGREVVKCRWTCCVVGCRADVAVFQCGGGHECRGFRVGGGDCPADDGILDH